MSLHSKRILASFNSTLVILAMLGCGGGVVTNQRSTAESDQVQEVSADAPADFPIGDNFQLTAGEVNNLRARIAYVNVASTKHIKPYVKYLKIWCTAAVGKYNSIMSDLAAANSDTIRLQTELAERKALLDQTTIKLFNDQETLSILQGKVAALKTAIAKFGPNLKAELARINREFNEKISSKQVALNDVRDQMDDVIYTIPFDLAKYEALDAQEDALSIEIANLQATRNEQIRILVECSGSTLENLKANLVIAEKDLAAKGPTLYIKIAEWKREIKVQKAGIAKVVKEISTNTKGLNLVLPVIPSECGLLGIK